MKKINLLFILMAFTGFSTSAQLNSTEFEKNFANLMNTKKKAEETQGSPYIFDEWESGVVVFKGNEGGEFKNIKIDLMNNQLEVLYMNTEKVLPATDFNMVKLNRPDLNVNTFFRNAADFKYNGKQLKGFAQITPVGENFKVVTVHSVRIIQSNMNAKIVGASHRKRLAREKKTFFLKKGKLYRIKKKKDVYKILTKKQKKLKAYISDHDLSVKKEADLVKILEYYESI
ncbi:MAG: hypothetical protein AB8H03_02340 [Saprospiraceae bacterium]